MNFLRVRTALVAAGLSAALLVPATASAQTTASQRIDPASAAVQAVQAQQRTAALAAAVKAYAGGTGSIAAVIGAMGQTQSQQSALQAELVKLQAIKSAAAMANQTALADQLQTMMKATLDSLIQVQQSMANATAAITRG